MMIAMTTTKLEMTRTDDDYGDDADYGDGVDVDWIERIESAVRHCQQGFSAAGGLSMNGVGQTFKYICSYHTIVLHAHLIPTTKWHDTQI